MRELNKYWKLSWGYIFDALDRIAHKQAIEYIWECVTASAEIKYFAELPEDTIFTELDACIVSQSEKSIILLFQTDYFLANFTFIKRKQWENTNNHQQ